jgi:hypothetical protein
LNGRWTTDESRRLGALISQGNPDSAEIVKRAWRAVLGRQPDAAELERGQKFLQLQTSELGAITPAASELARALFNTNEFLYVD